MVRISNLELLRILMRNSRTSFVNLARHFNVTETAIRKRVKILQQKGIIRKYTIDIDLKKIGFGIHAIIGIDTSPEQYLNVLETLKKRDEITSLYSSTGDHMIMLEIWLRDSKELREFEKEIKTIKGVTRICPAIILERIK